MKKLGLILIAVALCVSLITSCAPENEIDEVVDMKFDVSRTITRGLSASIEEFNSEDLYWKYTAVKADGTNYTTGQQETPVWLKETTDGKGDKGTSKKSLTLSVGTWQFALYGYKDSDGKQLAYQTNIPKQVTIENNSKATIVVSVSPVQTKGGKGSIVVSKELLSGVGKADVKVELSLDGKKYEEWTGGDDKEYINKIESGNYSASIRITDKNNDNVIYVNDGISINVYDYLTTYITGTPISNTQEAEITVNREQGTTTAVGTSTITSGSESTIKAAVSASSAQGGSTTITYPSGALSNGEAKTTIIAYDSSAVKDENNKPSFSISSNNLVLLGGLDLTVEQNGTKVESFNGKTVTVSTFIGKGMDQDKVTVKYDSDSIEEGVHPTGISYDPETGIVTFKTTHFSRYYILAEGVVAVSTNGYAYSNLNEAAEGSSKDDTIYLLKDVTLNESDASNCAWGKTIINTLNSSFDGNGYKIELPESTYFIYQMEKDSSVKNVIIKINNNCAIADGLYCPVLENVTIEGEYKSQAINERNNGIFLAFAEYGCYLKNCTMKAIMEYPSFGVNYNAAFVGIAWINESDVNKVNPKYEFIDCKMKGVITCGRPAVFIGNIYQMTDAYDLVIKNFKFEEGTKINWLFTEKNSEFNGLIGIGKKPNVTIDETTYGTFEEAKSSFMNNHTNVFGKGENTIGLSISKENDKLAISAQQTSNVNKYILTCYTYVNYQKSAASGRPTVQDGTDVVGISVSFTSLSEANKFKAYDFIDYYALSSAEKKEIQKENNTIYCGIEGTITKENKTYYVVSPKSSSGYLWIGSESHSKSSTVSVCAFMNDSSFCSVTV